MILGLTGSVGSGKSFVSSLLARCGAKVICADTLAREVVEPGSKILTDIRKEFGSEVFRSDGSLDRSRLAEVVFQDASQRQKLEDLIHPAVHEKALKLLQESRGHPLIILDVPLLFETGFDRLCDQTLVVTISDEERLRRLADDRGMTPAQIEARLSAQMPQTDKAAKADYLIDNSSSRAETAHQVSRLLHRLFPAGVPHPLTDRPLQKF